MKYYSTGKEEMVHPIEYFREELSRDEYGNNSIILFEAKRMLNAGMFWCKYLLNEGEVGEGCGKFCEYYKPRNGKSGRCVNSGHVYEVTDKMITLKLDNGKLKIMK